MGRDRHAVRLGQVEGDVVFGVKLRQHAGRSTRKTRQGEGIVNSKLVLAALVGCGFSMSASAADPTNSTPLIQCESAQGEVKRECEETIRHNPSQSGTRDVS